MNARALKMYPPGVLDPRSYERRPPITPTAPTLAQMFLAAYADPVPAADVAQMRRERHEDLPAMSREELARERVRATLRDAFAPELETAWFRERRLKLDAYAQRRR